MKSYSKVTQFHWRKCICKCRLECVGHLSHPKCVSPSSVGPIYKPAPNLVVTVPVCALSPNGAKALEFARLTSQLDFNISWDTDTLCTLNGPDYVIQNTVGVANKDSYTVGADIVASGSRQIIRICILTTAVGQYLWSICLSWQANNWLLITLLNYMKLSSKVYDCTKCHLVR